MLHSEKLLSLRFLHSAQIASCWALMDVCMLAQKHRFHFKPLAPLSQRETGGEKEAVCLCPTSVIQKSVLIKLYQSAGPKNTYTHYTESKVYPNTQGCSSHSVSIWTTVSLSICLCCIPLLPASFSPSVPPSHRVWRVTGCVFQPVLEHRAINAGQRERAGVRGGEGRHNWLLTVNSKSERL